jgi:DNA gyrase inhibitor GyrI
VNQFWTKINKILEKSLEYIKVCSDADNTITEEKHRLYLASQIQPEDNDEGVVAGSAEMRLGLYRQWFDVSKQRVKGYLPTEMIIEC